MKAVIYTKYGSPDVLQIKEIEKPVPKDDEVLIKVYAATVNRTDCATLRAKPFFMRFATGLFKPKIHILGSDFAGVIEAVGAAVTLFKVGDNVFGLDDSGLSSHAQYMTMPEQKAIATIPGRFDYAEATASMEGAHYAYNIINKIDLKKRQNILVNGGTGAIGSAAVQLLKYFGANVTAVCSTKNLELVKSIGADKVIDYTKEDFTKTDEKYHYVFDAVGKSTFGKCKPLILPGGAYISTDLGPYWQNLFFAFIKPIIGSKKVLFPIPWDCRESVLLIKKIIEEGKFKPLIDRTYPMNQIADAFRYVETGEKIGNVVVDMVS